MPEVTATLADFRSSGAHHPVILVADDDAVARNLIGLYMQQEGYLVLSAADGHEGLELSRQYLDTIDLVITDVQVPGLNCADLCSHLLEERPGIKLLLTSSTQLNETGKPKADSLVLPKPFGAQALKARVRAALTRPRLTDDPLKILSDLRSELEEIEQEIRSMEQDRDSQRKSRNNTAIREKAKKGLTLVHRSSAATSDVPKRAQADLSDPDNDAQP